MSIFTTANFDVGDPTSEAEDVVIRQGKLFEAGVYEDKQFAIDEAELDLAVADFTDPAEMSLEHRQSVLDGHLGQVRKIWRDGKELMAEFVVPRFLDTVAKSKGVPLRVSGEWDRSTKRLKGASWVLHPRIETALVAAFSASQPTTTERKGSMKEELARFLKSKGIDVDEAEIATFAADQEKEAKRLRDEVLKLRTDRRKTAAEAFADKQIAACKAMPSERGDIIAAFSQAQADDDDHGIVTFDGGATGNRVDLIEKLFSARPAHELTKELLETIQGTTAAAVLFAREKTEEKPGSGPMTEERRKQLLGMTELGRAVLAETNGKGGK